MGASDRLPWLPWWVDDQARIMLGWPPLARLAYRELLDHEWSIGALPPDPDALRRLVVGVTTPQWARAWPLLEPFFPVAADGTRKNTALEQLRRKQTRKHSELSAAGRRGALKRWGNVTELKPRPS